MVNQWIKNRLNVFYPPSCVLCGAKGSEQLDLCQPCRGDLAMLERGCYCCGLPLQAAEHMLCGACLKQPRHFDHTVSGYLYQPPFNLFIQRMKFSGALQFVSLLATLHCNAVQQHDRVLPQLLVPVPLHPSRVRERGFNQALELTREIARRLDLPYSSTLCHRRQAAPAQRGLSAKQRRVNLRGAFTVSPISGIEHIALLDDVMTTGSTFNELAKAFKAAGVQRVDVWPMARAI